MIFKKKFKGNVLNREEIVLGFVVMGLGVCIVVRVCLEGFKSVSCVRGVFIYIRRR